MPSLRRNVVSLIGREAKRKRDGREARMRRKNQRSAKGPQLARLQYGLRPPGSPFRWSPRRHLPQPLPWPLRLRLRGHPPERGPLRSLAQTEKARSSSIAGRPDLSVVLLIIGAAVGFGLLLFYAGWMQLYRHW